MATYAQVSKLDQTLVRKALTGSLFIAPYSANVLTASTLFVTGGALATSLPTGYADGGTMTDDGLRFSRSTDLDQVTGWQFLEPVRTDLSSDTETAQVDFLETNRQTIELYTGIDTTALTLTNGALTIDKPTLPQARYLRLLCLAVDNYNGKEFYVARHYPRVRVTGWADQAFAKAGALQWGVTLTAYTDPAIGASKRDFIGGPAFADLKTAMGFANTTAP